MKRTIAAPATIISGPDSATILISQSAYLSDEDGMPNTVVYAFGDDELRYVDVEPPTVFEPGVLEAVTIPNGYPITVRSTVPEDAVGMAGFPSYPLPVPVIAASLAGENVNTHIEALVEDDGFVSTLLLVTDTGLWVRYSGQWMRLTDVTTIDGLNSVELKDESVDLYDAADLAGRQLPIDSFQPTDDTSNVSQLVVAQDVDMSWTEPVTASGETTATIGTQIHSIRDMPAAVEAAVQDETARWYVERRARALGWEEPFPWA